MTLNSIQSQMIKSEEAVRLSGRLDRVHCLSWAACSLAALLAAVPALAQSQPGETTDTGGRLEEIVVTAERRTARLQDVPMSISAFNLGDMRAASISNTQDLQLKVPGLTYGATDGFAQPYIRGIGTAFAGTGLETSIATYVDDVYLQQQTGALLQLVDLGQVEVLKGPQGTLYGRNATGGAIIVRTQDPTDKLEGRMLAGYGSLGRIRAEAVLNMPVSPSVSVRLAGSVDNRTKGYLTNSFTGNKLGENEQYVGRGKIAFRPDDALEVIASFELGRGRDTSQAHRQGDLSVCLICNTTGYTPPSGFYDVGLNTETKTRSNYELGILRASYDFGTLNLSSVTSYRHYLFSGSFDQDFTPVNLFNYRTRNESKTFEQEVRLASEFEGALNFIIGGFYEHDRSNAPAQLDGLAFTPLAPGQISNITLLDAVSAFGEVYYNITPTVKITVGGRYNHDDRKLSITNNADAALAFGQAGFVVNDSFENFTPRVVLAYNDGPVNLYASYSKGFKSGGFNALVFAEPEAVRPEKLTSIEIGGKFDLLDRRMRLNISAFRYNYDDMQVTFFDPNTSAVFLRNAASARLYGVDADLNLALSDELRLNAGGAYLHARFRDFPSGSVYEPSGPTYAVVPKDLSKTRLPYAPTFSGFVSATYAAPINERWQFDVTALANYSDSYYFMPAAGGSLRNELQPSLTRINLTGGIETTDKQWRLAFYVENLTDKKYFNAILATGFGSQQLAALPRTYGASLEYRF